MQMSDIVDAAAALEEIQREQALANARRYVPPSSTTCWNCKEHLPPERKNFCDADCRDDWEARRGSRPRTLHIDDD